MRWKKRLANWLDPERQRAATGTPEPRGAPDALSIAAHSLSEAVPPPRAGAQQLTTNFVYGEQWIVADNDWIELGRNHGFPDIMGLSNDHIAIGLWDGRGCICERGTTNGSYRISRRALEAGATESDYQLITQKVRGARHYKFGYYCPKDVAELLDTELRLGGHNLGCYVHFEDVTTGRDVRSGHILIEVKVLHYPGGRPRTVTQAPAEAERSVGGGRHATDARGATNDPRRSIGDVVADIHGLRPAPAHGGELDQSVSARPEDVDPIEALRKLFGPGVEFIVQREGPNPEATGRKAQPDPAGASPSAPHPEHTLHDADHPGAEPGGSDQPRSPNHTQEHQQTGGAEHPAESGEDPKS